ncbi:MAG: hypothetical protein L7S51_02275 [Candidatus Marinimicrobia bacterium]|nr:hypothetical protein [Candidatus Neomarinimicrobiota bacterium]
MKILYGINATGNGHISRARIIIAELKKRGHDISCIISGRNDNSLYDIEEFKPFVLKKGFTFSKKDGKIKYLRTLFNIDLIQFVKDIKSIDEQFDLVITDFEPVSAYFSRIKNIPAFGIGHQYSFYKNIPMTVKMRFTRILFPYIYTPIKNVIPSHFSHFNQHILPPFLSKIITNHKLKANSKDNVLIYLAWEELEKMIALLHQIEKKHFIYYCDIQNEKRIKNVTLKPFSENGFKNDLIESKHLITNAGFQLPAEALFIGKKILCKPLEGQPEQEHNAKILNDLGYATISKTIDINSINNWLHSSKKIKIDFPNPLELIVDIIENKNKDFSYEIDKLWQIKKTY